MNGAALDRIYRKVSGRIVSALAIRFRDVDLAEEAFAETCLKATRAWSEEGLPERPDAWLYRAAERSALDLLRKARVRQRHADQSHEEHVQTTLEMQYPDLIPDERLKLIFVCCHPVIAPEARAALTLRLICGLTTREIARAFLITETTLAQRLARAKRTIARAGIRFEIPAPSQWSERLEAVLVTLEVAYAKAHEDGAGTGVYAGFGQEILHLITLVTQLAPEAGEAHALAALFHFAEARRPARVDADGIMVPLSEQDPALWNRPLIERADAMLKMAIRFAPESSRLLRARLQEAWCHRVRIEEPPPWSTILALYDQLLEIRDDPIVRLNRAVALAQVTCVDKAREEVEALAVPALTSYLPYWAVLADLLRRGGKMAEARRAYVRALALDPAPAERKWLARQLEHLP
jgi:RNA polymerase sigma-70 factor (ECF subfamily)